MIKKLINFILLLDMIL